MPKPDQPRQPVVAAVRNSETAKDLLIELGEVGLDQFLGEGLWRDLPGLRLVIGPVKIFQGIRDRLFVRKVVDFLNGCPKYSAAEKEAFVREHRDDPAKAEKLRDALVLALDRLDDLEKPRILAKVFAAVVRKKIEFETFRRLAAAIDSAFVEDLKVLAKDSQQSADITNAYLPNLLRTGLAELREEPNKDAYMEGDFVYRPRVSLLGRVFIGCMCENYDFEVGS